MTTFAAIGFPILANDSDWLRFVSHHDLRSPIVMAHIRKATVGAPTYRNAQPFMRELAGRMHCFAPVGETDSEQVFCALL